MTRVGERVDRPRADAAGAPGDQYGVHVSASATPSHRCDDPASVAPDAPGRKGYVLGPRLWAMPTSSNGTIALGLGLGHALGAGTGLAVGATTGDLAFRTGLGIGLGAAFGTAAGVAAARERPSTGAEPTDRSGSV